jgi:hypothetical protein
MDDKAKQRPVITGMPKERGFEAAWARGRADEAAHVVMSDDKRGESFCKDERVAHVHQQDPLDASR